MEKVDLRSDTMTRPTAAMRKAMADAIVGDDVFGEDPTVNRLQEMAAERLGKEAALLVTSGTMGNLVSLLTHCGRGAEMILGSQSHTFFFEQGGASAVGGLHPRTIPNRPDGTLPPGEIEAAIRGDNVHFPRTELIVLENTQNLCGGYPLTKDYMVQIGSIARRHHLKVHVDGARLFNAATALQVDPRELVADADSVSICLSKGLAAPVGSLICGSEEFIAAALRMRKLLGGGMRQAGIIAAAGIVALNDMVERLADDHANAKKLALGIADIEGLSIDPAHIQSNIVYFEITREKTTSEQLVTALDNEGVRVLPVGRDRIRAVTHYHISSDDIDRSLAVMASVLKKIG
jgi:threonine aldolase